VAYLVGKVGLGLMPILRLKGQTSVEVLAGWQVLRLRSSQNAASISAQDDEVGKGAHGDWGFDEVVIVRSKGMKRSCLCVHWWRCVEARRLG
jgi:hypothetical protein